MRESPLAQYVHPDLVYCRVPLAEEENGLELLRAANEAIVNDDDEIGHVHYAEENCECGMADCLACNYDYATILRKLAGVLEKNSRCLELYAEVLAKGRVQFPTPRSGPWFGGSLSDYSYDRADEHARTGQQSRFRMADFIEHFSSLTRRVVDVSNTRVIGFTRRRRSCRG
jgi:hypothetical protein